jgi:glycosyltransferase involved in cell wall biosynthesis
MLAIRSLLKKRRWEKKEQLYLSALRNVFIRKRYINPVASCIVITNRKHLNTEICLAQLRQNRNIEIIFVNNGGNASIPPNHPTVDKYITIRKDAGAYMPRNIAAVFAAGKLLIFIDDDGIPHRNMIKELISAHERYDIVSCCGCCKPITGSPWNYDCHHYYMGPRPFPYWTNLEGNCCINANVFYAAGGWDDNLQYGGGGYELSRRMLKIEPNKCKYAYIPDAILFHEYCNNAAHIIKKRTIQIKQAEIRFNSDPTYYTDRDAWLWMSGKPELLLPRNHKS